MPNCRGSNKCTSGKIINQDFLKWDGVFSGHSLIIIKGFKNFRVFSQNLQFFLCIKVGGGRKVNEASFAGSPSTRALSISFINLIKQIPM